MANVRNNRGGKVEQNVPKCPVCGKPMKGITVITGGKKKSCRECPEHGIFDKSGRKVL